MKRIFLGVSVLALSGCAHGMKGSPPYVCAVDYGYAKGTPEYKDCFRQQMAGINSRERAQNAAAFRAIAVGIAAYGAATSGQAPATSVPQPVQVSGQPPIIMCPDGTWQAGKRCMITPDG
jgi:hypothetical protein